jgi:small subunit ribosomal protein S2
MLFVLDVIQDQTAVLEARVLGVPIVGICDTNSNPTLVDYPIPGNDDSIKAINLYCSAMENAVIEGIQQGLASSGVDIGELEEQIVEPWSEVTDVLEQDKQESPPPEEFIDHLEG